MENQRILSMQADVASTSSAQGCDYYLPPGYHFVPTEEELITEYLVRKANGQPIAVKKMHEVNLYKFSPQYLTEHYAELGKKQWYFFTSRDRKYPNGNRPRRSVEDIGFWKATGADKGIYSNTGELIGKKKVLVFYNGKPKSPEEQKTNWIMHEYRLNKPSREAGCNDMKLDDWVLCQVHQQSVRSSKKRKRDNAQGCVAPKKKGRGKTTKAPTALAEEQECARTKKGRGKKTMAPPTALAEKQEFVNDDQLVAHGHGDHGNMIMAPPLAHENNEIAAGGSQEAAWIDNSHQFPSIYEYQDRTFDSLDNMLAEAGWNSLHDHSAGEMLYQDNNINYLIDPQLAYTCNVQQHQWPPNLQQDSWAMTTQYHGGDSCDQDISNYFIDYVPNYPEPENGFVGHGGQGDGNSSMVGQGGGTASMCVQGGGAARILS